ncbi:hypothetical protein [Pedobacter sp. MW01-1-1]|uniref:hypothetical protein n=1 Tax=Pedobacter sp. MW01-1-1 TaxID=3383027 RepID=UPI003FEE1962
MKKIAILILFVFESFLHLQAQSNEFYFNGSADVILRYPARGSGGRAIVHADNNVLNLNFGGDFSGGTMIGNGVYFKDGGNSFINSGNFGIGTSAATGLLELKKMNSNLVFDLNTNGLSRIISKGWNADIDLHTFQNNGLENSNQLYLKSNGYVGIGTDSPDAPLTVNGCSNFFPRRINGGDARKLSIDYFANNPEFISNDYPVVIRTGGGNQPLIFDAARIGIGTTTPQEKLSVNGNIRAREIKVEATNWPDYVFEEDYKITSLQDLEKYIKTNKHLPDMPSAKEVENNGLVLGEMNKALLKKVEELTLHLIDLSKRFENQERENIELRNSINELKKCKNK